MQTETNIDSTLNAIIQAEGDRFEYDEAAIDLEHQKRQVESSTLGIKILSIAGGILSTFAFLGFLMIAGLYDSEGGMIVTGILFMVAALWLNTKYQKLILDALSVTAYLIGLCLLGFGFSESGMEDNTLAVAFIIISVGALAITQNYVLSFISVIVIDLSILFLIINQKAYDAIHAYNGLVLLALVYSMLHESRWIKGHKLLSKLYNPIRIGLIIAYVIGLFCVSRNGMLDLVHTPLWFTSIINIPVAIYALSAILKLNGVREFRTKVYIYTLSSLCLLPTVYCPAISGALLIVLLSFFVNYRLGLSIGIISFVYFVSQYYYDLSLTLLEKSIVLFTSGVIFLVFFLIMNKKLSSHEEV